jgi:hypothetical protein
MTMWAGGRLARPGLSVMRRRRSHFWVDTARAVSNRRFEIESGSIGDGRPGLSPRMRVVVALLSLVGVFAVIMFVVYVLQGSTREWCQHNEVGCGLGIHFGGTLMAGLVAYLSFYRLYTEPRVLLPLLRTARRSPTELFPWVGDETDYRDAIGRKHFVRGLVDDVASSAIPHVIVGDGGSGKTTVLVRLTAEVAHRGMIPVPLTLMDLAGRDATDLDFAKFARDAFVSRTASRMRSIESCKKVWDELRPRVVLLVDDIEKATKGHDDLRRAFVAARADSLKLIAAARPDGLPSGLEASVLELDELSASEAIDEILRCSEQDPRGRRPTHEQVECLVTRSKMTTTPYFMRLAMKLAARGQLPDDVPRARAGARLALLEAYYEMLKADESNRGWVSPTDRSGALEDMERLACQSLVPGSVDIELLRIRNRERLVEVGQRMGVIHARRDCDLRFTQQVLQAFFASRLLRQPAGAALRAQLLARNPASPYLAMALVLAAAATPAAPTAPGAVGCAAEVTEVLLRCAHKLRQRRDARSQASTLHLVTAAVEAAALAGSGAGVLSDRAVQMATAAPAIARNDAETRRLKLQLIDELSFLGGEHAVQALWSFQDDPDYSVRWHAVVGITEADEHRFAAVDSIASAAIEKVKAIPPEAGMLDDSGFAGQHGATMGRLKPLAWMLPALHSQALRQGREGCAKKLEEHMREIQEASKRSDQHGILASLAQGFKLDAVRCVEHPVAEGSAPVHHRLFMLLDAVPFWYTKVVLLHAISLRLIATRGDDRCADAAPIAPAAAAQGYLGPALSPEDATHRLGAFLKQDALHPFVRAAGELCEAAIATTAPGRSWREYIWADDEAEVIARPQPDLGATALHLVADMALLLNLNEHDRRPHERAEFGIHRELPLCLSGGDRTLILKDRPRPSQCSADCPFHHARSFRPLCPDGAPRWAEDDASGLAQHSRRLLNRSFCRRLRHIASAQSWSGANGRQLKAFWAEMEQRAPL